MYKVKRFSALYCQKEYGNASNKMAARQWKMQQSIPRVLQLQAMGGVDREKILNNAERYKNAIDINKVLPSEGTRYDSSSRINKSLGRSQETLLQEYRTSNRGPEDAYRGKETRGVKKVRGQKTPEVIKSKRERIEALSPENKVKLRQSNINRMNNSNISVTQTKPAVPTSTSPIPTSIPPTSPTVPTPATSTSPKPTNSSKPNVGNKGFKLGTKGKIGLGLATAGLLAYGGKKLWDKKHNKKEK